MSLFPQIPPLDFRGVDADFIIVAIAAVLWVLGLIFQAVRRGAARARERLRQAREGHQPIRSEPGTVRRPATMPQPAPTPRVEQIPELEAEEPFEVAEAEPRRDLMSDLEKLLREQLGLGGEPRRPQTSAAQPPHPVAPARPAPVVREAPRPPVRPQAPPIPARAAATVQVPVRASAGSVSAGRQATAEARNVDAFHIQERSRGGTAAADESNLRAFDIRERQRTGGAVLREALRGGELRRAILLREILGPPRAVQHWTGTEEIDKMAMPNLGP